MLWAIFFARNSANVGQIGWRGEREGRAAVRLIGGNGVAAGDAKAPVREIAVRGHRLQSVGLSHRASSLGPTSKLIAPQLSLAYTEDCAGVKPKFEAQFHRKTAVDWHRCRLRGRHSLSDPSRLAICATILTTVHHASSKRVP